MDNEFRKLQRLYEQDPTEANRKKYRKALLRRGIATPLEIGDIVRVDEYSSFQHISSPWIGELVRNLEKNWLLVRFLDMEEGYTNYNTKKGEIFLLAPSDQVTLLEPM